ncbi:MAG: glucose-6-phosphate dehydrogenase, partial [Candidatus Dormibacteraeota bacterium]|nr:glucose-6-phosphate dehydrogenase [Candidatus Dormibacteraeota bacterium]
VGDRAVPAYAEEEGVDSALGTETYAEVELELESWRWTGTTFRLRTGKAMGRDRMEVAVRFREVPHLPFPGVPDPAPNVLRFGLDPETLDLELTGAGPGPSLELTPLTLRAQLPPALLPAYGRLLLDVLNDDPTLSIRGDEAEESWRIVDPVVAAWSRNLVPLEEYPAGSEGPARKPS